MIRAEEKVKDYSDQQLISWAKNLNIRWKNNKIEFQDPVSQINSIGKLEYYKLLVKESKKYWDKLEHTIIYKLALIMASAYHFSKKDCKYYYSKNDLIDLACKYLPGPPDMIENDFETKSGRSSKWTNMSFEVGHLIQGENGSFQQMDSEILKLTGPIMNKNNYSLIGNKGIEYFNYVIEFNKSGNYKKRNASRMTIAGIDDIIL